MRRTGTSAYVGKCHLLIRDTVNSYPDALVHRDHSDSTSLLYRRTNIDWSTIGETDARPPPRARTTTDLELAQTRRLSSVWTARDLDSYHKEKTFKLHHQLWWFSVSDAAILAGVGAVEESQFDVGAFVGGRIVHFRGIQGCFSLSRPP